ncbi:MAG: hypothetical protein GVY18_16890, partial [Bacteroidetes bacterium]|nr:hypothetical protein [Bacteroidota bacterium]
MTIRSITTLLFVALLCAAAATPATAQVTRYVATTGDDQQGDNDCTDPGNPCATIQQAVDQASFQVADVIEVAAGTYNEIDIVVDDKTLTIQGASAATTIIDAQNNGRILEVVGISDVTLNDLTLRNGEGFDGGAAYVTGGLTINRCVFENNTAPVSEGDSNGGAIFGSFATLSITESTFDANTASGDGGALFARSSVVTIASSLFVGNDADNGGGVALVQDSDGGSATLTNNTFYNNSASIDGGGLYYREFSDRSITVSSSTFVGNSASDGGGMYFDDVEASQGSLEYGNSLFADNAPNNIAQTGFSSSVLLSLGYNLLDDASGDPTPEPTDQRNTSPRLESLADNGGPTQTIRPLTSSPALDAGSCSVVSDQRGDPRPYDSPDLPNAPGGNGCDIGAVELQASEFAPTTRYVATTGSDTDNDCTDPGAPCATLDHAVTVSGPGDTIDVASGTYTEAGITLNKSLTITGAGATATTVQAAAQPGSASDRLFFIVSGVTVSLSDVTMSNGVAFGEDGGGILVESSASLTVQRSILRGHRAFDAEGGGLGGAIYSAGTLVLEDTFFEDNQAPDDAGGAVFGAGPVTVTTSTFTANSAIDGGAFFLQSASPQSI